MQYLKSTTSKVTANFSNIYITLIKLFSNFYYIFNKFNFIFFVFKDSLLQLIMGFGVPVAVRKDWSLGFGYNMQFQYALPPNIGGLFNLYNPVTYAIEYRKRRSVKEQRDTSREYFYLFIETLLEM